jgi:hypothetical protein
MEKITISKDKYERLLLIEKAFTKLSKVVLDSYSENLIEPVVKDFEETGLYSKGFIIDLKEGLKKSSYVFRKDTGESRVADK